MANDDFQKWRDFSNIITAHWRDYHELKRLTEFYKPASKNGSFATDKKQKPDMVILPHAQGKFFQYEGGSELFKFLRDNTKNIHMSTLITGNKFMWVGKGSYLDLHIKMDYNVNTEIWFQPNVVVPDK